MRDPLRQEAWAYGRALRDQLVSRYREEYGEDQPPALIIDELLTDFLGVTLRFDPLPPETYAQTEWKDGGPVVTVNSLVGKINGVKDEQGVQNVAKFHEAVHVVRDLPELKPTPQLFMVEFGPPAKIVCHRRLSTRSSSGGTSHPGIGGHVSRREFWAEEAGRAAAISYEALAHSDAFRHFIRLRQVSNAAVNGERWRLLYLAAQHIGVSCSAMAKQLQLEGQIVIQKEDGRMVIYPQPTLFTLMGG